jgi:hypothetical protein
MAPLFRGVFAEGSTRPTCGPAGSGASLASKGRGDQEVSTKIPSRMARAAIWCAVNRSITIIAPPQRGHGQDADGGVCSTVAVTSV